MGGTKGCKPCKACQARACRFSAQLTCTHRTRPQSPIRPAPRPRALCTAHRFPPRPGRAHRSNCSRSGPALAAQLRLQLTSTAPAPHRRAGPCSARCGCGLCACPRRPPAPAAAADASCATQCMPLAQQCTTMCSPAFLPCDRRSGPRWLAGADEAVSRQWQRRPRCGQSTHPTRRRSVLSLLSP